MNPAKPGRFVMQNWNTTRKPSIQNRIVTRIAGFCLFILLLAQSVPAEPWWSLAKVEEARVVDEGLIYERVLYDKPNGRPVRAHILSVTAVGSEYIFGVIGAFGVLLPPSEFAKQSGAIAAINGGFFSKKPTRSLGLVVAHNRILYPPHSEVGYRGTVGFTPTDVLFDWIGMEDINGIRFQSEKPGWNDCHSALGGGPMLIQKGRPRLDAQLEGFNLEQSAPRTAIGKNQDGYILMVVVDGRQSDWSEGVTLPELVEIFLARGALDALNLDGGGSSTLVLQNQIANRPSDIALPGQPGRERPVSTVIALFPK